MFIKIFVILTLFLIKSITLYAELSFNDVINVYGSSYYKNHHKGNFNTESRIDNRFIGSYVIDPSPSNIGFKFETHLLSSFTVGDDKRMFVPVKLVINDDRTNLFNLTNINTFNENNSYSSTLINRIDRFYFSIFNDTYEVTAGRNTLTWSRGRLFHVADFFHSQTPEFFDYQYKLGTDLIYVNYSLDSNRNLSIVANPKRNYDNRDLTWNDSTFAIRYFESGRNQDYSVSLAQYLRDYVVSLGSSLDFIYSSILRIDASFWSPEGSRKKISPAVMVSIEKSDYYFDHFTTLYLEYMYNGLGKNDISKNNSYSMEKRLQNKETYLLGKNYLSIGTRIEITPYVNFNYSNIISLQDWSIFNLASVTYSYNKNLDIGLSLMQSLGGNGDEFGKAGINNTNTGRLSSVMLNAIYNF